MRISDIEIDKKYINCLTRERKGRNFFYSDTRTKLINGTPHVYPIGTSGIEVYICCPYCGQFHIHGINNGNYKGGRVPHCVQSFSDKQYVIECAELTLFERWQKPK